MDPKAVYPSNNEEREGKRRMMIIAPPAMAAISDKPDKRLSLRKSTIKAVIIAIALIAKFALDWYMRTKSGFLLRSVGDNEGLVITLAKNPGTIKIIGLSIANGLVSLAGAVYCQYSRAFNVGSGTGTVVMGLAAVIIGTTVFKKLKFMRVTTGVLLGMIVYKACISIALAAGLRSQDTNFMITVLFIATLVVNEFFVKKKKAGVKRNG